ncbi:16S rRNA (cytidine(1402)-2'-O)-methyltransferase [bacterium]|nr:16S rRNA (cytidine(1402)-2'-O)-methyltransferase [bacterium]
MGEGTGVLYLVGTPIGNLEDITLRALRILKESDLIAAEDTRRTGLLLHHYGIKNRMESYHAYNQERRTPVLISQMLNGKSVALVSDAGSPGISDPAFHLVCAAARESIPVIPVPGPSAAVAAVTVSGLPTNRFAFEGFLPVKKGRSTRIETLKNEERTIILYESPHRLLKTLADLERALGDRPVTVCRELTKKFEEVTRGTLKSCMIDFEARPVRGEFVLILGGNGLSDEKNHAE